LGSTWRITHELIKKEKRHKEDDKELLQYPNVSLAMYERPGHTFEYGTPTHEPIHVHLVRHNHRTLHIFLREEQTKKTGLTKRACHPYKVGGGQKAWVPE
jgi:hypothetical protein